MDFEMYFAKAYSNCKTSVRAVLRIHSHGLQHLAYTYRSTKYMNSLYEIKKKKLKIFLMTRYFIQRLILFMKMI